MALQLNDVNFTSSTRYEYVVLTGHVSFAVAALGLTTATITHDLGYEPYVKLWYKYDGVSNYYQLFTGVASYGIAGNGGQIDNMTITTTTIDVDISENLGTPLSGVIYYRIYAEPRL